MKAEDTVLDTVRIYNITGIDITEVGQWERFRPILETQAEISFKAGIKEVVEWIIQSDNIVEVAGVCTKTYWMNDETLQSKLKEWGLDAL